MSRCTLFLGQWVPRPRSRNKQDSLARPRRPRGPAGRQRGAAARGEAEREGAGPSFNEPESSTLRPRLIEVTFMINSVRDKVPLRKEVIPYAVVAVRGDQQALPSPITLCVRRSSDPQCLVNKQVLRAKSRAGLYPKPRRRPTFWGVGGLGFAEWATRGAVEEAAEGARRGAGEREVLVFGVEGLNKQRRATPRRFFF